MKPVDHFSAQYSQIYDALHTGKDYAAEVAFVLDLCKQNPPKNILDIACGTGRHVLEFAKLGHRVFGNDLSSEMLEHAKNRLNAAGFTDIPLSASPMQSLRREQVDQNGFDLITAYYTCMGYLVAPEELNKFVINLKSLLKPGGYFFADVWNGQRMAKDFSPHRVKETVAGDLKIHRESFVSHFPAQNALKVEFNFKIADKKLDRTSEFIESHLVRYHYGPELANIFLAHGFSIESMGGFFDESSKLDDSWNFYVLVRKGKES
jgi:SAM-dependent methyltransferase